MFLFYAGNMLSSSNLLQSAFEALYPQPVTEEQKQEAAYKEFEKLCRGSDESDQGRRENPDKLVSIHELGETHYKIDKTNPYFIAAQIINIKHPTEGKGVKELSTDNTSRLKSALGKRDAPGGSRVSGNSKELVKYNRMVVFRYYVTVISTAINNIACPLHLQ
jgi:hypothetical protein